MGDEVIELLIDKEEVGVLVDKAPRDDGVITVIHE